MQPGSSASGIRVPGLRGLLLTGLGAGALLLGGCADDQPESGAASPTQSTPTQAPESTTPDPSATSAPSTGTPRPGQRAPAGATPGTCGSVAGASGKTLQVQEPKGGGPDCAEAHRIVARFHKQIAGKQPTNSDRPMGMDVDGWQCVSGPPTANGGTTCIEQDSDAMIAAKVLPGD